MNSLQPSHPTRSAKRQPLRILFRLVLLAILVWILWTGLSALLYMPYPNRRISSNPLYLKGGYHLHSTFSDGQADLPQLAREAKKSGLDWIILTDHGGPNPSSEKAGGWIDRTLVIGASEASTDAGHLAVIGASTSYRLPFEPQLAIDELNRRQGLSYIAHPGDNRIPWTDWSVHDFSGIEILSAYESVKRAPWNRYLQLPLQYLINPRYAVLNLLSTPEAALKLWDRYNHSQGRIYSGIFATDAHGKLPLGRKLRLPFPSYESLMSTLVLYVPSPKTDFFTMDRTDASAWVVSALRDLRFFNVIETMAPADGVEMAAVQEEIEDSTQHWQFRTRHPLTKRVELKLLCNGEVVHHQADLPREYQIRLPRPGRYRAELHLPDHRFSRLPWVIGNPFDIPPASVDTKKPAPSAVPVKPPESVSAIPLNTWTMEVNQGSTYEWISSPANAFRNGEISFRYSLNLPSGTRDAWCSLATRDVKTLVETVAPGEGIYLEIAADRRTNLWLDIRTRNPRAKAQSWYRHSVMADKEISAHRIPFAKMVPFSNDWEKSPLNSTQIIALFISINNQIAFVPSNGEIRLLKIGGYRK